MHTLCAYMHSYYTDTAVKFVINLKSQDPFYITAIMQKYIFLLTNKEVKQS